MTRILGAIALFFSAASVSAQTLPNAPGTIGLNRADRVLEVVAVASIGADAYATHLDWSVPAGIVTTEVNPLARVFVSHGTAPLVAYFAAGAGTFALVHRKIAPRHHKLVLALDLAVLGSETYYTQYSLRHHIDSAHWKQVPAGECH